MNKIQNISAYIKELSIKIPNEKEIKMGLLLDFFFEYILQRTKDHESLLTKTTTNKMTNIKNEDRFE